VFTPPKWAYKIVYDYCFRKWVDGATVLDPTAGDGAFIKAFLEIAANEGVKVTNEMLERLYGIELNPRFVEDFYDSVKDSFGIEFPAENYIQGDVFFLKQEIKADILVGNPPWVNFTDLEECYKEKIKHLFIYWGLVKNPQDLLLGKARTDIATLVLSKVIHSNLNENGNAIFFIPLSIFQNDGANQEFRNYNIRRVDFCVEKILDFNGAKIFEDILGRYGVAFFKRNQKQTFPIKYFVLKDNVWDIHKAQPLFSRTDALTVFNSDESESRLNNFRKITLPYYCQPRQGVNTCGANDIFFFDQFEILEDDKVKLESKNGEKLVVRRKYVFPLTVSSTLKVEFPKPEKLVLIPHFNNGKPLDLVTLQNEDGLYRYLLKFKEDLQNRKGILINTWIKKGFWWALMGIGPYSFAPYKIMWKAFGDSQFTPKLLKPDMYFSTWQGNQSLNAYIGVSDYSVALSVYDKLRDPIIQEYLSSLRMQGTCNWAQPGRLKKIMQFV